VTDNVRHSRPAASGFSLVELLIAIVVIAIGVLALSAIQTRSSRDVYAEGRQAGALALASERIESIRARGYASAVADTGQSGPYSWITDVQDVSLELRQVDVTVTWNQNAAPRSLTLQTLISDR